MALQQLSHDERPKIDIAPLLTRLWPPKEDDTVTADEIATAVSYLFTDQVAHVQAGALLMCLHFTGWDRQPAVLSKIVTVMMRAAAHPDAAALKAVVDRRGLKRGTYGGGFCDIVGTGGDSHNTFNVSTTSSILASSLLLMAKHGNKASTSKSGSADLLANMHLPAPPVLSAVRPDSLPRLYGRSNYAFLFAPVFHPGMCHVAPIRRQLPWRTVFNLVGPLANPVDAAAHAPGHNNDQPLPLLEARLIGVARRDMGPVFAEALGLNRVRKALVVCGDEQLDEISCAGITHCWRLARAQQDQTDESPSTIEYFTLHPADFGLPTHPLASVGPGREAAENAAILTSLLRGDLRPDDPVLHFVLMNTAALFVVSGICDADDDPEGVVVTERGPGGARWKEGVRRARWAIESGAAARQWAAFVEETNALASSPES